MDTRILRWPKLFAGRVAAKNLYGRDGRGAGTQGTRYTGNGYGKGSVGDYDGDGEGAGMTAYDDGGGNGEGRNYGNGGGHMYGGRNQP